MSSSINSLSNPLVKYLTKLNQKASFRKTEQCFMAEGSKEILVALNGLYPLKTLLFCPSYISTKIQEVIHKQVPLEQQQQLGEKAYQKIAYRGTTEGVIGLFRMIPTTLNQLKLPKNPTVLILDGLEKPGNVGGILRTCEAAGVHAVIIVNSAIDLYNPNLIRASLGTFFSVPVAIAVNETEVLSFCKQHALSLYASYLNETSEPYDHQTFNHPLALIVGSESKGISNYWLNDSNIKKIIIPMVGKVNSINVSVASAVLIYKVFEQKLGNLPIKHYISV